MTRDENAQEILPEVEPDHEAIYLEPRCCASYDVEGRTWCSDDIYDSCEHDVKATKYIRADLATLSAKKTEDEIYKCIGAEIRKLQGHELVHPKERAIIEATIRALRAAGLLHVKEK